MKPNLISMIPSIDGEELVYLQALTHELNDQELMNFASAYNGKRRTTDQVLIGCIFGYIGIAGVQRFMVRQNVMGILFLFTAGFCFIGTIIDTINHRRLTFEYNQQMARESMAMMYAYR